MSLIKFAQAELRTVFNAYQNKSDNDIDKALIGLLVNPFDFNNRGKMRVAVVHEWFVTKAGSESVVEQILKIFPQADVFSVVNFMDQARALS